MPEFTGGNLGLTWGFAPHEDGWGDNYNDSFMLLDATTQLAVIDSLDTPPVTPANEAIYIVIATATGAWTGQETKLAVFTKRDEADTRDWHFFTPKEGWRAWHVADANYVRFNGTTWVEDTDPLFTITTPAEGDVLRHDGTTFVNVRPLRGFSFGSDPTAVLDADQIVFYHRFEFAFTIPADFADYLGASTTIGGTANAADGDVVLVVQKADNATPLTFSNVGTLTVGNGTVDLSAKSSSAVDLDFLKGDVIMILGPTVPDSGFKGVAGSIIGYEPEP